MIVGEVSLPVKQNEKVLARTMMDRETYGRINWDGVDYNLGEKQVQSSLGSPIVRFLSRQRPTCGCDRARRAATMPG